MTPAKKLKENDENPAISVIMPVYNGAEALPETLEAVFKQTFASFELIAVDDGSSDESLHVLHQFAVNEPRLKVLGSSENKGAHEARRKGLAEAKGQWIAFVDADDLPRPNMLARLHEEAASTSAPDIVIAAVDSIDASGRRIGPKVFFKSAELFESDGFGRFCRREFGSAMLWNKLYRRELMEKHGGRSFSWRQDATEDTLVNIGCFHDAKKIMVIPDCIYGYRKHAASATQAADRGKRYARLLASYVEAVTTYAYFSEDALQQVDTLFRLQIGQTHCGVSTPDDLKPFAAWLEETIKALAERRPSAIYELMNQGIANPMFFEQDASLPRQWLRVSKKALKRVFPWFF